MSTREDDLVRAAVEGVHPTSQGWAYAKCPLCGSRRRSLSVAVESGWWRCFKCGSRGRIGSDVDYGSRVPDAPKPKAGDWYQLADPGVQSSLSAQPALDYLITRRVSPQTIVGAELGVAFAGKLAGRIILPIRDDSGEIVGVVARAWASCDKPYHNTAGLQRVCMPGRHVLLEPSELGVYGVEGPFDCLPYWGWAFSFLGKPTDLQLAWIQLHARRPVIIGLDGDAHVQGRQTAARLAIRGVRSSALVLPAVRDPGDFLLPEPWRQPIGVTTDLRVPPP